MPLRIVMASFNQKLDVPQLKPEFPHRVLMNDVALLSYIPMSYLESRDLFAFFPIFSSPFCPSIFVLI